jgi:cation diffusion facilitator CzcD-associated flavoprotein CzcO
MAAIDEHHPVEQKQEQEQVAGRDGAGPGHVRVAVIGTGFGGLGAGVRLAEAGISDFIILERADAVGGTWRDNTYPGCACDVPSHLYSFSFAPNPNWTHSFSRQAEIRSYLEGIADRYRLHPHIRFQAEVTDARWDASVNCWRLLTGRGPLSADVVISATGPLADPSLPDIPGLAEFPGAVFHSARWDHSCSLAGKRVAVIGTGASAIQIVPEVQRQAARLVVFQRTPAWVMPQSDREFTGTERWLYRHVPAAQRLARLAIYAVRESYAPAFTKQPKLLKAAQRIALRHLARSIPDPTLRAQLTPNYVMGCKRILLSNHYYPALAQANVDVVASGLARVVGNALYAEDGSSHEVDAIVLATGFHTTDMPIAERIHGVDGRSLARVWDSDMRALRGTTVAGFPNLCLVIGPNTGLGHTSMVHIIESQLAYIIGKKGAPPDFRPARPVSEVRIPSTDGVVLHGEIHGSRDAGAPARWPSSTPSCEPPPTSAGSPSVPAAKPPSLPPRLRPGRPLAQIPQCCSTASGDHPLCTAGRPRTADIYAAITNAVPNMTLVTPLGVRQSRGLKLAVSGSSVTVSPLNVPPVTLADRLTTGKGIPRVAVKV